MEFISDLKASRELGTARQLWSDDKADCDGMDAEYSLRPASTRKTAGLANNFPELLASTTSEFPGDSIEYVDVACSEKYFKNTFVEDSKPAMIHNCTEDAVWPSGRTHWDPLVLIDTLGGSRRFEVAGENATVSLRDFVSYIQSHSAREDDNPVYIFETLVDGEHDDIISKFIVPPFFTDSSIGGVHTPGDSADLLSAAGEDGLAFGVHRWFLLGPKGSGSNMHVDPLGTSAWNTLLLGRKMWVLFPPGTNEEHIKAPVFSPNRNNEPSVRAKDFCAAAWFAHVLPDIQTSVREGTWLSSETPVQFVQQSGETVYVPAGWWHVVINLETTACVTQNIAEVSNYAAVAKEVFECCDDGCEADEWRERVIDMLEWSDIKSLATDHCVHCGSYTRGGSLQHCLERSVCKCCESNREEYELLSSKQVESRYDLKLKLLPDDEVPPHVFQKDPSTGKNRRMYINYHIKSIAISAN